MPALPPSDRRRIRIVPGRSAGFDGVLAKPIAMEGPLSMVGEVIG